MSLMDKALEARAKAYAPYSEFKVGSAIRSTSGNIYIGCNVENASYPEGTCAEAGAIAAMVAAGDREIAEVAVVADSAKPVSPCGGCRQRLAEFAKGDVPVYMGTLDGVKITTTVAELLPDAFEAGNMDG